MKEYNYIIVGSGLAGVSSIKGIRSEDESGSVLMVGKEADLPYNWDHAIKQGKNAGRNMAGSSEVYDYLPYFFSDLFDYGFEAVGQVDSSLDTYMDWKKEGKKGAIYYLSEEGNVRGVLLLGLWGKKKAARQLIKDERTFAKSELEGEIS